MGPGDLVEEIERVVKIPKEIISVARGRDYLRGSENHSALAQYLITNAAVVEIRNGESQEEAWRRYLADNPQSIRAHVKIFHYPTRNSGRGKSSTKTARAGEMA